METILDCGHTLITPTGVGTGYAVISDDKRICYACADAREVDDLKTADTFVAYLSNGPQGNETHYRLTTWTGGMLARVDTLSRGNHNIGGFLYRFRATDVHGVEWYGTSPGPGMYARMRRCKVQTAPTRRYRVVWAPSAQTIAVVSATSPEQAKRRGLKGTAYRKYPGEVYVETL